MFHPLAPNLSELSSEELNKKHGELISRLNQAYRIGPSGIVPQLQMMLTHYSEELQRRQAKQLEELTKQSPNFKNIIDIK
jgi:SAM-dependent MidA family methyltransferase